MTIPPLAANAVADLLTKNVKRDDGRDSVAFQQQRNALVAMRETVHDHDGRLAVVEGQLSRLPFPFEARS